MTPVSQGQMAEWCGGALIQGVPSEPLGQVCTDTRKIGQGDVFLALKGDNFDGHDFVKEVTERNLSGLILSSLVLASESFEGAVIHVRDTLQALQSLAKNYRRSLDDLFVVGVTGSNGKTSTKDFLKAVLSAAGPVNATKGNLNNHIGLPLTVLESEATDRFGVWEMGMNHPGEIEPLADIAAPNAAVITNIGTAHIEHMKTREAIAEEKGMLAEFTDADGFIVMPAADEYTESISGRSRARMISVGIGEGDVRAEKLESTGEGTRFEIAVPGGHMVTNALLAVAVGLENGIGLDAIADRLANAELTGGRLQRRQVSGVDFLDDSYNANPDSMRAALKTLADSETSGRRVAVLGFMGELGEHEESEHRSLGQTVAALDVDLLVTVTERARLIHEGADSGEHFDDHEAAAVFLQSELKPGDLVLVKGSRAATMETVLEKFAT